MTCYVFGYMASLIIIICVINRNSASILGGVPLPWTSEAVAKIGNNIGAKEATTGKKLTAEETEKLKSKLFKPIVTEKKQAAVSEAAPKKKGFFGF
jgi:hypothetical protein